MAKPTPSTRDSSSNNDSAKDDGAYNVVSKIVDWDGPEDKANPINWSVTKKTIHVVVVSLFTLNANLAATMYAPDAAQLAQEFGITNSTVTSLTVSLYVLGFAFGPLLLAPLSELYGRLIVYHLCNIFYIGLTIGCAFSTDVGMFLAFRLLAGWWASGPMSVGAEREGPGPLFGETMPLDEESPVIPSLDMLPGNPEASLTNDPASFSVDTGNTFSSMDSAGTFSTASSQSRSLFRSNGSPSTVPQQPRILLISDDGATGGQSTSLNTTTSSTTCECGNQMSTFFAAPASTPKPETQVRAPDSGQVQLIEAAVEQNTSVVSLLDTFLSCRCSEDEYLLMIATLMACKLVDVLAKVTHPADGNREREDSTLEVTELSLQDAGASGDEDKSRVAMYKLVGQTYGLQRRVGALHEKIKAVAGDNKNVQDDHRKATAEACRLPLRTMEPLAEDLVPRIRALSKKMVARLQDE